MQRLARHGYDAIEVIGELDWQPGGVEAIRRASSDNGVAVSSICALYGKGRDLCHRDAGVRDHAVDYVREMADLAAETGAAVVVVGPAGWGRLTPLASERDETAWAVESLRRAAEHAADVGVGLTLEPWNRFETYFMNRLDQAVALARAVGMPNVGAHGDTFHMNIEERSVDGALRDAGAWLTHVHMADSNRGAPGDGHLDVPAVMDALRDIDYHGVVCFEPFPAAPWGRSTGETEALLDGLVARSISVARAAEVAATDSLGVDR